MTGSYHFVTQRGHRNTDLVMGCDGVCSLLRQGMDKLIVSMEGVEARNVEEKAQRDGLSRNEISKVGLISMLFSIVCGRLLKSTKFPIENWVPSWDSST